MTQNNDLLADLSKISFRDRLLNPPNYQGSIFAKTQFFGKNKVTIAFDWLEFTATGNHEKTDWIETDQFRVEFKEHGTQYFTELAEIHYKLPESGEWIVCANLELKPRVSFISQDIVKIKLDNRFCYQSHPDIFIKKLVQDLKITFKNYTRIDTACDFQSISLNESVQDLLLNFSAKKYIVKSKSMEVYHRTKDITGIRWGRRDSGCAMTLYNKTLDMSKKGEKPYIRDLWASAEFNPDCEVYRLEISEKKNLMNLVDELTEQVLECHCDIAYIKDVQRNFKYLYKKHFQAAKYCPGVRFSRMEKLNVLDMEDIAIVSERISEKKQANNYIKAHIKRTFEDATRYDMAGQALKASYLYEYIQDELEKYSLQHWFNKKFPMYQIYTGQLSINDALHLEPNYLKVNLKQAMLLN
jgi:hypothetical protein